jgi:hypothetical protein
VKFACFIEETKIPKLDSATSAIMRKEVGRWMPERDSVGINDV